MSLLDEFNRAKHETLTWNCLTEIFERACENGVIVPDQERTLIFTDSGNLVMYGGVSALWEMAMGNGTTTADQALTYFSNTRAAIGTGDGSSAAVATQNNLQGTNKLRKAMNATFPQHTDGLVSGSINWVFESTYGAAEGNWAGGWQEWGIFNSATDGNGRMLNRKVINMGVKPSSIAWDIRLTLSIA